MIVNTITPAINPVISPNPVRGVGESTSAQGGFGQAMADALDGVGSLQNAAHASAQSFLNGETEEIHKVALDQQKAAISLDLFLQVRNKVVGAYQEIMKMQV